MRAFFTLILKGLKSLGSILLPMLYAPARGLAKTWRWVLHILILILVLAVLTFINYYFDLQRSLRSPWPFLHQIWLPMLFLLLYIIGWLGLWLWKLLGPDQVSSNYPDIDDAWHRALQALNTASVDLKDRPVFLILGRCLGNEGLFYAANVQIAVLRSPRGEAPLHVYATPDAVYVTCTDTSLLSFQATHLAQIAAERQRAAELAQRPAVKVSEAESDATKELKEILENAKKEGRGPDQLTDDEKNRISELAVKPDDLDPVEEVATVEHAEVETTRRSIRHSELVETYTARLTHLCRLIVRERRPYCAINGILVLLPLAATDEDKVASQTATLCQDDLQAARDALQVDCPIYMMVCDLEQAPGCAEVIANSSDNQKLRALGRRFPLVPDIDRPEMAAMYDSGVYWICQSYLPARVYERFNTDTDAEVGIKRNAALYQFLWNIRDRTKRFSRIVTRGTRFSDGTPPLIGGFFLAATGADANSEQAFVAEVFREMLRNQNFVSWTPQALIDENRYRGWIRLGISTYVIGFCLLAFVGYMYWLVVN